MPGTLGGKARGISIAQQLAATETEVVAEKEITRAHDQARHRSISMTSGRSIIDAHLHQHIKIQPVGYPHDDVNAVIDAKCDAFFLFISQR